VFDEFARMRLPRVDLLASTVTDLAELPRWETILKDCSTRGYVAWDTETSGFDYFKQARIIGHCFGYDLRDGHGPRGVYFPIRHQTMSAQLPVEPVTAMVKRILEDPNANIVGHNLKFDALFGRTDGIQIKAHIDDTLAMSALIDENIPKDLEFRAVHHNVDPNAHEMHDLVHRIHTEECRRYKVKKRDFPGFAWIPVPILGQYGCKDGYNTLRLFYKLSPQIRAYWSKLYQTEMKLSRYLEQAEWTGVPIDIPHLEKVRASAQQKADIALRRIWELAGSRLVVSSDDELRNFLYNHCGYPVTYRTRDKNDPKKEGQPSVDARSLKFMIRMGGPATELLQQTLAWREADKLLTTYTTPIIDRCDSNSRLHCQFKQVETTTGRLACAKPNLQNIPSDDESGIRKAFVVPANSVSISIDFSQIELRVLAHCAREPTMTQAFINGEDIHSANSKKLFNSVEKKYRRIAKVFAFGTCIAEGQRVLTNDGLIPIEKVKDWHLVWDGLEWVSHQGVVCRGECETITWGGLTATPEHEVYTTGGSLVRFETATSTLCPGQLARGATPYGLPARYVGPNWQNRAARAFASLCSGDLFALRPGTLGARRQYQRQENDRLRLPSREVFRSASRHFGRALRLYAAALLPRFAQFVGALQGSWDSGAFPFSRALCALGLGDVSELGFQRASVRSHRQRRALLAAEFAAYYAGRKQPQSSSVSSASKALVYDILNAGPRHRFVVEGVVVSNSYGMSAHGIMENLNETAEPEKGIEYVSEEQAETLYAQFHGQYPRIHAFRDELCAQMLRHRVPQFSNPFGRTRRVPYLRAALGQIDRRAQRQVVASMIQGTAADIAKEAMVAVGETLDRARAEGRYDGTLVLTIHDENRIDVNFDGAPQCVVECKAAMENFPQFAPIAITTEAEWTVTNWEEKVPVWLKGKS